MWNRMFKVNSCNLVIKPILNYSWPWCFNFKPLPMQCWMTHLDTVNAAISGVRAQLGGVALSPGSCNASLQMQCAEPCFTWSASERVWGCHTGISHFATLAFTSAIFLFFFQNDLSHPKPSHPILLAYMCLCICAHACIYLCVQMYREVDDGW